MLGAHAPLQLGGGLSFGYITVGPTPMAQSGEIRLAANQTQIVVRNAADNADLTVLLTDGTNQQFFGSTSTVNTLQGSSVQTRGGFFIQAAGGGSNYAGFDGINCKFALPISGYAAPMPLGVFTQAMADANQTPSAGNSQFPKLITTGAITANRDCVLPNTNGGIYFVDNQCTGAFSVVFKVSGQVGVTVANGKKAIIICNGTDYQRWTPDT